MVTSQATEDKSCDTCSLCIPCISGQIMCMDDNINLLRVKKTHCGAHSRPYMPSDQEDDGEG